MEILKLHCFSLKRQTPLEDLLEFKLPCSLPDALAFLALYFGQKNLGFPMAANLAYAVEGSPFFVRQITVEEIVAQTFAARFPIREETWLLDWIRRLLAYYPVMTALTRQEKRIPETVFELFTTADRLLLAGPLPEHVPESLVFARFHFWAKPDKFTYIRILYGWTREADPMQIQLLYDLLWGYIQRILHLFGEGVSAPAPSVRGVDEACRAEAYPADSRTTPINSEPFMTGARPRPFNAEPVEPHHIIKLPRIYSKSLAKVCQMVSLRQQQIEKGQAIPDIETVRDNLSLSINTLRKLPELVSNWTNPAYRWYADTWLREQSGHKDEEITQMLSDVRERLLAEDWALVIAAPAKPPPKAKDMLAGQNRSPTDWQAAL